MSKFNKVGTGTISYIKEVGCSNDCSKTIPINRGLPLPCKEFTNMESALLRKRALKDDQLWASGFTKIVDRSAIGDDLRIKNFSLDIGEIRTEASGARSIRECSYNYEGISIDEWEKRFYVVNTNKHLKLCPRDLVGSSLQDLIGDKMTDFDEFQDTDLADILVGAIIEKYTTEFIAKFILLAVFDNEGENMHGDDGVFAKAWYAYKGQYYNTVSYDLSYLDNDQVGILKLEAIVGGKRFSQEMASAGGPTNLIKSNFVNWINGLKEGKDHLYNASFSSNGTKVIVVSRFAATKIRLRVGILGASEVVDWSGPSCSPESAVPTVVLQNAMPINDVPLLFKYEEINETNFVPLFKRYLKEFTRWLHRNGFSDYSMDDVKIAIDPELMLERDDAVAGKYLAGGISIDFMQQIGLSDSRFFPMNALNNTGLFMMTVEENILVLGDASNDGNGLPGTGTVKVTDICDGQFSVIFDNPIGSAVEHFGLTAFNLCDSYFILDNKLDERQPYQNTRDTLACYSSSCKDNQLSIGCDISATVSAEAEFDGINTLITVIVDADNPNQVPFIKYNLGYSLSDGTNDSNITTGSFIITLPGDQTNSGIVLNVFGNVSGSNSNDLDVIATSYCIDTVNYSVQIGEYKDHLCDWSGVIDVSGVPNENNLYFTLAGVDTYITLINPVLDFTNENDWAEIEDEIEAIFPLSTVTITGTAVAPLLTITNLTNIVGGVTITHTAIQTDPTLLISSCA